MTTITEVCPLCDGSKVCETASCGVVKCQMCLGTGLAEYHVNDDVPLYQPAIAKPSRGLPLGWLAEKEWSPAPMGIASSLAAAEGT